MQKEGYKPHADNVGTPISHKQFLANQQNAQKSTGPVTEEGKNHSRMNARRHGLTGQFYALNTQDQAAFDVFRDNLLAVYKPANALESQLAISIAEDHWRLNRARAIENNTFAWFHSGIDGDFDAPNEEVHSAFTQATTWRHEEKNFGLLALYEHRIRRNVARNEDQLHLLQAERKAEEAKLEAEKAKALEEAKLIARLRMMKQQDFDVARDCPKANGFVFSNAEIRRQIIHESQVEEARHYEKHGWKSKIPYEGYRFHAEITSSISARQS